MGSPYISLDGVFKLLGLPPTLIFTILKYFTVGLNFRKFRNDLKKSLKLTVYRTALSLAVPDTKILARQSNEALIKKTMNFWHRPVVSQLPGYGERYDSNSFWIVKQPNRDPSDPVIIYSHGGGYFMQTQPQQLESLVAAYKLINPEKQKKVSILLLDYSLACFDNNHLPAPLHELHETYSNLTKVDKNSNIILFGDSAGANLSIIYTQFLKVLASEGKIKDPVYPTSMILVSPWCRLSPIPEQFKPGQSYYDNDLYDMIRYKYLTLQKSFKYIIGDGKLESLTASPNSKVPQEPKDWGDIPTYTKETSNIFVVCGEDEVFRDDILHWAEYALGCPLYSENKYGGSCGLYNKRIHQFVREGSPGKCRLEFYMEPWGVHDSFFFFENEILAKIKKAEANGQSLDVDKLSEDDFFATKRIVKFLDKIV